MAVSGANRYWRSETHTAPLVCWSHLLGDFPEGTAPANQDWDRDSGSPSQPGQMGGNVPCPSASLQAGRRVQGLAKAEEGVCS